MTGLVDNPLDGPVPVWRESYMQEEPIYREMVADLGMPGLDSPDEVVEGELEDCEPDPAWQEVEVVVVTAEDLPMDEEGEGG